MAKCGQCDGEGEQPSLDDYERNHGINDFCYHCNGTGKITKELANDDFRTGLIEQLARENVEAEIAIRDTHPDGEDWAFLAAENMLSPTDYSQIRMMEEVDRLSQHLEGAEFTTLDELKWLMN